MKGVVEMSTIGQRICAKRQELGWTQEELAKKMGYKTRNAIYQYEKATNMKLSLIEKFADVLGCPTYYLMGWESESEMEMDIATGERLDMEYCDKLGITLDAYGVAKNWDKLDKESQRQVVLMLAFLKEQSKNQE